MIGVTISSEHTSDAIYHRIGCFNHFVLLGFLLVFVLKAYNVKPISTWLWLEILGSAVGLAALCFIYLAIIVLLRIEEERLRNGEYARMLDIEHGYPPQDNNTKVSSYA